MANADRVDVRENFMVSVQAEESLVASHISSVALKLLLYVRLRYSLTVSAGNDEGIYLRYYGNCCLACRVRETYDEPLARDHIIPRSKGGLDSIHNIQPLCRSCNSRKGTTTVDYRAGYQQFLLEANTPSEAWLQAKLLQPENGLPVPTRPHFNPDEDQVQLATSRLHQNYQPE